MDVIAIREVTHTKPFIPFTLKMNDGREFYSRHPELISVCAGLTF